MSEQELVTKKVAGYTHAQVEGQTCHSCESMNDDGTCKKVEGIVKPEMVCVLWSPK